VGRRLLKYHATTGVISLGGNLVLTLVFAEFFGLPILAANTVAVVSLGAANFVAADRWVFAVSRPPRLAAAVLVCLLAASAAASAQGAELQPETVKAWTAYVSAFERDRERKNDVPTLAPVSGESINVADGTIHRWRGATLVKGMTLTRLFQRLQDPGTPPPQEEVLESRVLARSPDRLSVYLKIMRRAVITVTYDTEHTVMFDRRSPTAGSSRSVATRIVQADGGDHGFLWRLNSYWRYLETPEGVIVELESLSLSRGVPMLIRPMAGPIIGRVAQESVNATLDALRHAYEQH
jgi:hypothetical protein